MFALTNSPAPLLTGPHYLSQLQQDDQGLIREVETILFPGVLVEIEELGEVFSKIQTNEYPSTKDLWTYSALLQKTDKKEERQKHLPPAQTILDSCRFLEKTPYIWGGNWPEGLPHLKKIDPTLETTSLKGVDCSGLLYFATGGYTPRNTSDLVYFGQEVCSSTLPPEEIQSKIKPLDLLVWRGHVLIVLDKENLIESRVKDGVVITPFRKRFAEIVTLVKEANKTLHIRRWFSEPLV